MKDEGIKLLELYNDEKIDYNMKKNYLKFVCLIISMIMLCVGCNGNKTSSSDPLEIKKQQNLYCKAINLTERE